MQKQMKKSFTELFNQSPELLTREQAAEYLGITPRTLAYNCPLGFNKIVRSNWDGFLK